MNNKLFKLNISADYELEFRIKDLEFINSILKKPTIKPVSFEDAIVLTYIPTINFKKYKYRSTHILNSISSDKYERKELIYRDESKLNLPIINEYLFDNSISNLPNPLVYPAKQIEKMKNIDVFVKYSRETSLANINSNFNNLKIDNIYRKLRITYNVPTLNFKIDLTCRYYPILLGQTHSSESINSDSKYTKKHLELNIDEKQKIIKELMEEMQYIKFKPEQVLKFENIDGYNLEIDMEFEYLHNSLISDLSNSNSQNISTLLNEYNKLICFLSNYDHITFSILKRSIPFDFTKSPQVNILTNQIINTPNSQNNFV